MKNYLILFTAILAGILAIASCGQRSSSLNEVPYGENPVLPGMDELESLSELDFSELTVIDIELNEERSGKMHVLNGKPYIGWVRQLFPENEHRFRYMLMEDGLIAWQVGYYDDGTPDMDFHMKNGLGKGSQRMWYKSGGLYVETYYKDGGIQHGPQKRWYGNGKLAMDAMFENGEPVYEVLFDKDGSVVNAKGDLPEEYKNK